MKIIKFKKKIKNKYTKTNSKKNVILFLKLLLLENIKIY